jgi:phosphatidylglycerol lysyltransferase
MTDTVTSIDNHYDAHGFSAGVRMLRPRTSGKDPQRDSDPQFDTLLEPTNPRSRNKRVATESVEEAARPRIFPPPCRGVRDSSRWRRAEHHAFTHGKVYDSYFATESGWKQFWSADRSGLVSYRRLGRYVKVIGGLLAAEEDQPQLLREFIEFTRTHRLTASFFNVTAEDAPLFREHGFEVTKWGEEPLVDLQECSWSGKQFEWVRRQTNFCRRAGISIIEHRREEMDDVEWNSLIQSLRGISDEQLATKSHSGTISLLEGQLQASGWGRRRLFVAYSSDFPKRIEGFLVVLPMQDGRQWALEMYRHRPDAVRGVVPHLFHVAMMRMKAEGIEVVSLSLIPGLGCEEAIPGDSALTRRALAFSMKHLNFLFDFAGIYHFKSRFRPRYEDRYICALPKTTLRSSLALFRISGMVTFNFRRVGSSFLQKHFKRSQRAHLAAPTRPLRMSCQSAD